MFTKLLRHHSSKPRAQAMVEFAIVLPILVVVLIGMFEVGRIIFIYAAVTNASREAARYGSALGFDSAANLYHKYRYCDGIRATARKSAFFLPVNNSNITIQYDYPPNTTILSTCNATGGEDTSVVAASGERVIVTVTYDYSPLTRLVPFPARTFTSKSARTILGSIALDGSGGTGPGGGGLGGGPTSTLIPAPTSTNGPTPTASDTPTATNTATATATGAVSTFTPGVTPSITLFPSNTPTATITRTPTATRTSTATATATSTPTSTATPVPGCGSITASALNMPTNGNTITMTITNPHDTLTVSSIYLHWNGASGGGGGANPKALTWQTVSVGTIVWTVGNSSGDYTTTPGTTVTIPGNNTTTTITITFDINYKNQITNGTTLTINLSTPGCSPITKTQ